MGARRADENASLVYMRRNAYSGCVPRLLPTTRAQRGDPELVLRAFAEPTRLRLLVLLAGGETCVCDLVATLELPQPAVSRHLAVLRKAGLVSVRKDGLWCWYTLAAAQSLMHGKLLECLTCCRSELNGLDASVRRCTSLRRGRRCC